MDDRAAQYRIKLLEDFPGINILSFEKIGEGWDNEAYVINGDTVFRIPKTRSLHQLKERIAHTETEINTLNKLKGKLPVQIPEVKLVAKDGTYYGYSYSRGVQLGLDKLKDRKLFVEVWIETVVCIAKEISLTEASNLGIEEFPFNDYRLKRSLEALRGNVLDEELREKAEVSINDYKKEWASSERVVVHGDLGLGNWVYDADSDTYAVIDWSDVCLAPQEFQMYRLVDEIPEYIDFAISLYKSRMGIKLNKKFIFDCGVISNLSMIGALLEKEGPRSEHLAKKIAQLKRWVDLECWVV